MDTAVSDELSETERHHVYGVDLRAGELLYVELLQEGADLVLVLFDPERQERARVDSPVGNSSAEQLWYVAELSGRHRVEVRADGPLGSGRYEIRRSVRATERAHAKASARMARADILRRGYDEESRNQAVASYREALELWKHLDVPRQQCITLNRIGATYYSLGEFDQSADSLLQGLEIAKRHGDLPLQMTTLSWLGKVYRRKSELAKAVDALTRARVIAHRLGDAVSEAAPLNDLAIVYKTSGQVEEALENYLVARDLYREIGDHAAEAMVLSNIASAYIFLGKTAEAMDACQEALEISAASSSPLSPASMITTLNAIGWLHHDQGRYREALSFYEKSIAVSRSYSKKLLGKTLTRKGRALARLGRKSEALAVFQEALELLQPTASEAEIAHAQLNLARLRLELGDSSRALKIADDVADVLRKAEDHDGEVSANFLKARIQRDSGNLLTARKTIEDVLEEIESFRLEADSPTVRRSLFEPRQRYYEFYIEVLMDLHGFSPDEGFDELALAAVERTRARTLLDLLQAAGAKIDKAVDPDLLEEASELRSEINELRFHQQTSATPDEAWPRHQRDLLLRYESLQSRIHARNPAYAELTHPREWRVSISTIQGLLDPETILLAFFLGDERGFLWRVDPNSVDTTELPARDAIEAPARAFYRSISESHQLSQRGKARLTGGELSRLVLGSVADRLDAKRLVIVADGPLQYIPFAALVKPGTATPLIVDHEIVMLPSASVLATLRRDTAKRAPAPKLLAILADPVVASDDERLGSRVGESSPRAPAVRGPDPSASDPVKPEYDRLPYSSLEARAIRDLVPEGEEVLEALGLEANLETVRSGRLREHRILHFATHGLLDTQQPELSALVLSLVDGAGRPRNGFLYLHDVYELDLAADLVVLSACRTALGKEIRGEGLVGLTHGFFYAGAARVLVSLWNINDQATAEMMKKIYSAMLRDGETPAAALRRAQLSMREDPRLHHPSYWGAFVLQGDWR